MNIIKNRKRIKLKKNEMKWNQKKEIKKTKNRGNDEHRTNI